ncbi:hypothetical protein DC094_13255 [Pelagibaculum spongiae]|uniref:RDD domain-containing protein n=1 Tax=Pelagibaculum spongiae TaxID=2080658 RepID=A0A2V1GUX6_9GAMM|nr:hypothetical protein DC094_13255 [Pelagibaculum spongiae]
MDNHLPFETPEGVVLQLEVAGLVARSLAFTIDLAVRLGLMVALSLLLSQFGGLGQGIMLLAWFVLEWFYPVLFELLNHGATPGKKAMGLRVVMGNGATISASASLVRNLLRTADFLPFLWLSGIVCMLLRTDSRRLGDLVADTLVIYKPAAEKAPELPKRRPLMPKKPLNVEEQRALVAFAERSHLLSQERCQELAAIVAPDDMPPPQRVEYLQQLAAGLTGYQVTRL